MNWWSWMIGGAILLGAELGLVNAQFYLVFVGVAALAVGLISLALPSLSPSAQWALFALLAVISMLGFRNRLYRRLRGRLPPMPSGPAGGVLMLPAALQPGQSCQVEYGGSHWTVRNASELAIGGGERARIVRVQGLTLLVRPDI